MRFPFKERKAAQAAAQLLTLHGGKLNYMVLIKLLYLADRRSLLETGQPITGDRMVSMDKGPVLSRIYDFVSWGPEDGSPWFEYISEPQGYDVALRKPEPETGELSRYELRVLKEIHDVFGNTNKWDLVKYCHTLPEWHDPRGSALQIEPAEILRAADRAEEEISRISGEAEELWFFESLRLQTL